MNFAQHIRAVLVLGLPLVGSHLAQFSVHVIDTVMLGWYDVTALAASVLATSFFFVVFIMGAGFSFAVMPMVAEAAASDDGTRIRRVTRMGLWLSVLYSLVFLPLLVWSAPVLRALGQDPALALMAQDYLAIVGVGLVPSLLVMVIKSYLAALERTAVVLWVTLLALVVNSGLNYALIFGNFGAPEMGLRGAAIASVVAQTLTLLVLALYVAKSAETRQHALFTRIWRPDPEAFREVFRLGWPIGLTNLAESGMFSASALIIGLIGTLPLAAHGIALQITAATFMIHVGLSQAATVRAGRALGRRDWAGLALGAKAIMVLSMGVVLVTTAMFLSIPEVLMTGFLGPDDPDRGAILAIGASLLAVAALFQLVDAGQVMALGLLRGMQDTRWPMVATALSYWGLGIPASYVLGVTLGFGGVGVWVGLVIGLVFASAALWWRYMRVLNSLRAA
ncbi:MATE family efflux transporter [uncultured Litoreibacter sp.]|uniref:MATE family efflux transporter n=1 Tax=uncultured Litoreibacter sp. TaxID=1392394 RepID=UPI002638750C|nr:MATE family efflux transporter [uncultured Litoreibacter sp.]